MHVSVYKYTNHTFSPHHFPGENVLRKGDASCSRAGEAFKTKSARARSNRGWLMLCHRLRMFFSLTLCYNVLLLALLLLS